MSNIDKYDPQTDELEGGQIRSGSSSDWKALKVACVAINAMGHFTPILNCAAALSEKGHDVTIITNGTDAMKKKATPMAEAIGVSMAYTDCGLDVDKDCLRKPKG